MGRSFLQVLWMNFSLSFGTWVGFKISNKLFWDESVKYKIWEETETEFWRENPIPNNLDQLVVFDSVINPGTVFKSYLPPLGEYIEHDYYERYLL
jgi:hypothetical protein